jgi:hypothetical protein
MAIPNISGQAFVSVGFKTTLTADVSGGTWASSDTSIATVGSSTGIVTGVALGDVTISYTFGSDTGTLAMSVNPVRISNGFNLDRILPAFRERLGWHQPTVDDAPTLNASNKRATSGRYYDRGFHQASTVMNMYDAQETSTITDDDFNQLLQDADDACTMQILNAVFTRPAFIEHMPNYTRIWNMQPYLMPNQDNMVGYRMNIAQGDYAVVLNSVSLFFSDVATFNLYLYNDLLLPPVAQIEVTTEAYNQTRVQLGWVMNYLNSSDYGGNTQGNIGGVMFLCYRQSEVAESNPNCFAIDEQMNLWTQGKVMGAFPFQSPESDVYAFTRNNPSINFRSYGLNIEYTCYRDYTQYVIQNPALFDEAKGLAMAIYVIDTILNSNRVNGENRLNRYNATELARQLDQAYPSKEFPFVSGLKARLERELKMLNAKFNGRPQAGSIPVDQGLQDVWANYYQGFDLRALPPRDTFQSR